MKAGKSISNPYICDFETTVYEGQTDTEVWSAAIVEMYSDYVKVFNSIDKFFGYVTKLFGRRITLYFHNLKFDGTFILSYFINQKNMKEAAEYDENGLITHFKEDKELKNNEFKYAISTKGQWYTITAKIKGKLIIIKDSLKLLPFSVAEIGDAFKTEHRKLDMEYEGERHANGRISAAEMSYIKNDVLVVKEAMEKMFDEGHTRLTIGSCCLAEYKQIIKTQTAYEYDELFPNLYETSLDKDTYGFESMGEYILKSYRGAWCYYVKGAEGRVCHNGVTADVNSLYPYVMHSCSGNWYPVGQGNPWNGNEIPQICQTNNRYYFVRVKTRFRLKEGKLPFIQIKGNLLYKPTEMLETSDVYDPDTDQYYSEYIGKDGNLVSTRLEITWTKDDYELVQEHYELIDFEILSGVWFFAMQGIFDLYIDKWTEVKMHSKGALRTMAKLYLNNLYGKMASTEDSSFKVAFAHDDGSLGFYQVEESEKDPGYIPCGSCITSKARRYTIEHAQLNYHGPDARGFKYADTDSLHCDLEPDELIGINVDSKKLGYWKLESYWDQALFCRQKTYIEHVTHADGEPVDPYYNITCAGMPKRSKYLFESRLEGRLNPEIKKESLDEYEKRFLFDESGKIQKARITDLKVGLWVPGKLRPKQIPGGTLLVRTDYCIR